MKLTSITSDLSRGDSSSSSSYVFTEEINFRNDTSYSLSTMLDRALASVRRAFKVEGRHAEGILVVVDKNERIVETNLPSFSPSNKLRITVEVITDEGSPAKLAQEPAAASKS